METAEIELNTARRTEFRSITERVADAVRQRGWNDGILTVFIPHTTAAVTINENADPDVAADMTWFFEQHVPQMKQFRHSEGNSDAHIKASLIGSSVQIIVKGGRLWLGTWQGIYFCEFDGPRARKVSLAFS